MKDPSSIPLHVPHLWVVVLAGPPAAGKSTLAARLATALDAPVFDKDRVRLELYGPEGVQYTREQDDACLHWIEARLGELARERPGSRAILDGRTFGRREQVDAHLAAGARLAFTSLFVACTAPEHVLFERVLRDRRAGAHPAANRDERLVSEWLERREPLTVPHLELDTHACPLDEQVRRVRAYVETFRTEHGKFLPDS